MEDREIIKISGLKKYFRLGSNIIRALRGVDLSIKSGEFVVVFGPSGSGKTTLLSMIAGLDRPSAGEVLLDGQNIFAQKAANLAKIRRCEIGIIFQQYNLISNLTALDNISMPLILSGVSRKEAKKRALYLIDLFGLKEFANHRPAELSGGQQQRIAIARALATNPKIILADEPTGNLDGESGREIIKILQSVNQTWGRTVILVTHNPEFMSCGHRIVFFDSGKIDQVVDNSAKAFLTDGRKIKDFEISKRSNLRLSEILKLSFTNFLSKKLRTLLTTLGVVLGVASIVTLVSLGIGLQRITANELANFNALVTIDVSLNKDSSLKLDQQAVSRLSSLDNVGLVSPTMSLPAKVSLKDITSQAMIVGITPESLGFEGVSAVSGKNSLDSGVIVSKAVLKNFQLNDPNSILGRTIEFTLIVPDSSGKSQSGYAEKKFSEVVSGVTSDELVSQIYVDLPFLQSLVPDQNYSSIKVKAADRKYVQSVRDQIETLGFLTKSVVDLINQVDKVFTIFQIVLGLIGAVALIVALIGIINIMTISLLERTHEVGILKAIGATDKDIKGMFEYEVIFFGFFGGFFGVSFAWLFGYVINFTVSYLMRLSKIEGNMQIFVTPTFFAVEMVILTVLIAALAGLYPARRASRLSPLEALRYE